MKFAITLLIIVSAVFAHAQNAFVVNMNGDTIEFEKVKISNKEIAGIDASKAKVVFAPSEVKGVMDDGRTYIPLIIDNRKSGSPAFFKDSTLHFGQLLVTRGEYRFVLLNLGVNPGEPVVSHDVSRFYVVDESGTTVKWICTPFAAGCPLEKFNVFRQYFDVDCPGYLEAYKNFASKPKNVGLFNKMIAQHRNCGQ